MRFGWLIEDVAEQLRKGALWAPVLLGIGIGAFFSLKAEPGAFIWIAVLSFGAAVFWFSRRLGAAPALIGIWCLWLAIGFSAAQWRTVSVAGPVLGWRYYGPIEGTVVGLDRSASERIRVTLADPNLARISKARTPEHVRISLHSEHSKDPPTPNTRVMTTGFLSPPSGPVEPGGYDFQRKSWFLKLGAVGYTRLPLLRSSEVERGGWAARVFTWRMALSEGIRQALPGRAGGFATAILTGDRAHLDKSAVSDLRDSNLAHLLAISGLHMGLLTGLVFGVARLLLVLFQGARHWPIKKIAAGIAACAGAGYLVISGSSVATERAFIMVAVMLGAVMLDRPALSLRAVAIAATIILALWPENLLEPGFQMSFSATAALVVAFRWINSRPIWLDLSQGRWRFVMPIMSLLLSSFVAGLATAPFAAYHFNRVAHFGLIANTLSLPVMGMVVMPFSVLGAVLAPFGMEWLPFKVVGWGIDWILSVAAWVAVLNGAVTMVPAAGPLVLPLITLGAVWITLWQSSLRLLGLPAVAMGFWLWANADRPDILVSDTGRLVGMMTEKGRALNRTRGSGFAARVWLENDADSADQRTAAMRPSVNDPDRFVWGGVGYLWDKNADYAQLKELCDQSTLVIVPNWKDAAPNGCRLLRLTELRDTGSLALMLSEQGPELETARQLTGTRYWNSETLRKRLIGTD